MVARTWRGWTRSEDADEYAEYIAETGLRAYRETPGNRGAWIMRRDEGDTTEFVTLSFWDSLEAIRASPATTWSARSTTRRTTASSSEREERVHHWQLDEF